MSRPKIATTRPEPMSAVYDYLLAKLDAALVARAHQLHVVIHGAAQYYVAGGSEPHYVELALPARCDCGHHIQGGDIACKHIVAVLLALDDAPLARRILRALEPVPRRKTIDHS